MPFSKASTPAEHISSVTWVVRNQPSGSDAGCERPTSPSFPPLREQGWLWVLFDEGLGFCVHGRWSSGESRWLHKHTVARGTTEVHSALDSPIVLTHCQIQLDTNPDPLSKLHSSYIVHCSSSLPHPHLFPRCHPVRKLSYRGALVPAGVPGGLGAAGVRTGAGAPVRQISLGWLLDRRLSSRSLS